MGKTYKKRPAEGKRIKGVSESGKSRRSKNVVGDYFKNPDNDFFDLRDTERKNRHKY